MTRFRNDTQLGQSTTPSSVMITNSANNAIWLAPPANDRILFYDQSANSMAWLNVGSGLSFNGTTLDSTAGSGFLSDVQEEGVSLGAGLTTINFIGSGYTAAKVGAVANVSLDADLNALADITTLGFSARTAANTWTTRTIQGTSGRVSVTAGDGSANPVIDIDANVAFKNATATITSAWTFNQNVTLNGTPVASSDAVNKGYVDGLIAGVRKSSVKAASTATLTITARTSTTLTVGGTTFTADGVSMSNGDRYMQKNDTAGVAGAGAADNGIFTVGGVGSSVVLTRATDMDATNEIDGTMVIIENGTQQGQRWYTVSDVTTLGTDSIVWTKIQDSTIDGSGAANRVTYWSDADTLTSASTFLFDGTALILGDTAALTGTRFHTKGTGTNNTTYAWQHKDSANNVTVQVANNGELTLGQVGNQTVFAAAAMSNDNATAFTVQSLSNLILTGSTATKLRGGSASSANTTIAETTKTSTTIAQSNFATAGSFSPAGAGTNAYYEINVAPTINQTGGHTGATFGVRVIPVLTSAVDFRGVDITAPGQTALRVNSGKVRVDFGSDATGDIWYRTSTGEMARLGTGTSTQVLVGGTTPSWGNVPSVPVTEAFITGIAASSVDLDANTGQVKDRDGNNIAFTVPTDLKKLAVYYNGQRWAPDGAGGSPTREYSVNTTTHVITFNTAIVATDEVYLVKLP